MFAQVAGVFSNAAPGTGGGTRWGLSSRAEEPWWLAEFAGDVSPDGMQRLLNFSPWDEEACRDAVRRYVVRNLGDPAAVLAVDERGFLKKGKMSAGVARQYTGTAGRIENAQVGVFLAYAGPDGSRALSTGSCTCRRSGRVTGTGAGRPQSATISRSRRSRSWPGR